MLATAAVYGAPEVSCRHPVVDACGPLVAQIEGNPPATGDMILVKKGDIIDVGLDWSSWLLANGGKLKTSSWAAHADSPADPTLTSGTLIDAAKNHSMCLIDTSAAAIGATYWLENTMIIEGIPAGAFVMPDRTLKRVIYVKVVQ